jgi:hypothetical protein
MLNRRTDPTEGVVKAMFVSKIPSVLVFGLTLGGIGVSIGLSTNPAAVAQQPTSKPNDANKQEKPNKKAPVVGGGAVKGQLSKITLEFREVEAFYAEAQRKHLAAKARFDQLAEKAKANENKHTGKDDNKAFLAALELNLAKAQLKQTEASLEVARLKRLLARTHLMDAQEAGVPRQSLREGKSDLHIAPGR